MKTKFFLLVLLCLSLFLNACSPFTIVSASGQQPSPAIQEVLSTSGYQPVAVEHVEVEVGVGSPIPVFVKVSGSLPDTCAQIEYVEQKRDGSNFVYKLSAIPSSVAGCIQDTLPFTMSLPLNVIGLPTGKYSVEINGVKANFSLDIGVSTSTQPAAGAQVVKSDIKVDAVNVEVGVGSPIPVHAIVSGNLPNTCAQLGEIRQHRDSTTYYVQLLAYLPGTPDCADNNSVPFRLEIPLNIVNLPAGSYKVIVNGATADFDPYKASAPEFTPTVAPHSGKIPAPSFEAQTYINEKVGFAMEYPTQWTVSESKLGERASQAKFVSAPEIADLAELPEGATRISAVVYQWDPKNDLDAYLATRKQAWESSGFTIQEENKVVLDGGLNAVQVLLDNAGSKVIFQVMAVGDQYLVISGEGDLALVKEILHTVRAVSPQ